MPSRSIILAPQYHSHSIRNYHFMITFPDVQAFTPECGERIHQPALKKHWRTAPQVCPLDIAQVLQVAAIFQIPEEKVCRNCRHTLEPDHIAGVCEAMRFAIAVQHRSLEEQKAFFERFLYRGAMAFCDAVTASDKANFYRLVAVFAREFLELEREAFGML